MIINTMSDVEFERMGAVSRLDRRMEMSGLDDYGNTATSGQHPGYGDERFESENIDDLESYLMSTNSKVKRNSLGGSVGRNSPRNGFRNGATNPSSRSGQSDILDVTNIVGDNTRRRRSREQIESHWTSTSERGRPVGQSSDLYSPGSDVKVPSQYESGTSQRVGSINPALQERRNSNDSNADSTTSSNRSSRPKSAYHSRFRRPRNMSNSDCDSDIETIPLDDSGSPVFEEEIEFPRKQASKPPNATPRGYDVRNSGWFDSNTGNQGNGLNRKKLETGFQGDRPSRSQQLQQSGRLDSFDDSFLDDEIDDSNVQGILRIKRKHLRRRFMSEHDSEWESNSNTSSDPSDRSSPGSLSTTSSNNPLNATYPYQNPAEKVLEKYKKRASIDLTQSVSENSLLSGLGSDSMGHKKAHPSVPRKLRPLFPRAGNELQDCDGGRDCKQSQNMRPLPLDMRSDDTDTRDHGVTVSPEEAKHNMERIKSHMIRHLNEEQLQQLDMIHLNENKQQAMKDLSLPSHKGRFVIPEGKMIDPETAQQDGVLSMLTQPQSVQRNRARRGELRPIRPQPSRGRRERAPEARDIENESDGAHLRDAELIKKSPSPRTLAPISKRKNSDPETITREQPPPAPALGLGGRQQTILDINLKDKENKRAAGDQQSHKITAPSNSPQANTETHLVPEKQPLGRTRSNPESHFHQAPKTNTRTDNEVMDMMADLNWCKSSQNERDPFT